MQPARTRRTADRLRQLPIGDDLERIETAIDLAGGDGSRIAVDANGRFDLTMALEYAAAIAPYGLRWFEETGDPLDYAAMPHVAALVMDSSGRPMHQVSAWKKRTASGR